MQAELKLRLTSLEKTREVGHLLGKSLPRDGLVLFFGEMGAGKTTLIKSICEGLGRQPDQVISPTYTIVNIYPGVNPGDPTVFHVDLFRMETPEALLEMDPADWLNPGGITLIEWPEAALTLLPETGWLEVRLEAPRLDETAGERADHLTARHLTLTSEADAYRPVFNELKGLTAGD